MDSPNDRDHAAAKIVLLAGRTKAVDRIGHHDYRGGCALLGALLEQSPGVNAVAVHDGWPEDETLLDGARSLVVYAAGGGKQAFLATAERIERMRAMVDAGVGLVMIHQAVCYPRQLAPLAIGWLGGAHVGEESGRGHWRTQHREFPAHPVTRGVRPWTIRDGWLNEIRFTDEASHLTPLLWSGRAHRGSPEGGAADVVSWAFERRDGGRSFCFTGLDAHSAWSIDGVRQLLVNGILWSAGRAIPESGAPCAVAEDALNGYLTPRKPRGPIESLLRQVRRFAR